MSPKKKVSQSRGGHKHYWNVVHLLWASRNEKKRPGEVGVMRYCRECGERQAAFVARWGKIPASHVDMKSYDVSR